MKDDMRKKTRSRLNLRPDTIRNLSGVQLIAVVGGQPLEPSQASDCDTLPTSGNPGACQSAFVTDCCK